MSDETRATVWRIKTVRSTGAATSGDWTYYEDFDRFEQALYSLAIEAEANARRIRDRGRWRKFRSWWERDRDDDGGRSSRCVEVLAVDQLVSNEWVPVEWAIEPPRLVISGRGGRP